jgi:hypothetical protein
MTTARSHGPRGYCVSSKAAVSGAVLAEAPWGCLARLGACSNFLRSPCWDDAACGGAAYRCAMEATAPFSSGNCSACNTR